MQEVYIPRYVYIQLIEELYDTNFIRIPQEVYDQCDNILGVSFKSTRSMRFKDSKFVVCFVCVIKDYKKWFFSKLKYGL